VFNHLEAHDDFVCQFAFTPLAETLSFANTLFPGKRLSLDRDGGLCQLGQGFGGGDGFIESGLGFGCHFLTSFQGE
jgi:hypothetical protein